MHNFSAGVIVILTLNLVACATGASRTFSVDVSPIGVQYTPQQVRDFLGKRGFERVAFERTDDSRTTRVLEVRTAELNEQRFRLRSAPQMTVIVRLETSRRMFGGSGPRLVVRFIENGRVSFSAQAQQHYEQLLAGVVEITGADGVRR